jgi:hypothetical protein
MRPIFYLNVSRYLISTFFLYLDIKDGSIVGVALLRKMKGTRDLSNVYSLLESQLGAKRIREVDHDDAYAMITVKGKKKSVFLIFYLGQVRN